MRITKNIIKSDIERIKELTGDSNNYTIDYQAAYSGYCVTDSDGNAPFGLMSGYRYSASELHRHLVGYEKALIAVMYGDVKLKAI